MSSTDEWTTIVMWIVGVGAIILGSLQALAATGKLDLDSWPFVSSESRALRFAAAAWGWAIGLVALLVALLTTF
jgi:hypothetical protein